MAPKKKRQRSHVTYEVTFENKKKAIARIEFLIDAHPDDNPYVECKGCEMCDEIEDIRKSFIGDIVGKKTQKGSKNYKKRVLTEGTKNIVWEMLEDNYSGREISKELAISLNTVEFFKREWVKKTNGLIDN